MDYSFGNWVKRRRKALDLTQLELARQLGCSVSLIFKIESDERRPSRQIAELLAEKLEIPPDQRAQFLKVARQEKAVDALEALPPPSSLQPAPAPRDAGGNLPLAPTTLIGREHELRTIIQHVQDPVCRLLNLTGPGGVGKTRLALEAVHQLQGSFEHGAYFISLAGTNAPEFIVPAIAESLGFEFAGALELKTQLLHFLRERKILLVLDNLEHLLAGIELLDEFLSGAPRLKLLTTSRESLNLRAEWIFEVQGLPIPADLSAAELESNSAAALFLQRARQSRANFTMTSDDARAIVRICRLVEGLPLGLELAASWVRAMSVGEIAREIEQSLDFLATSARDVPPRHRSIRAVFDYSWELLTEEEQRILRQLAVFSGGFTRDAAERVADAGIAQLSALVDKSLLRRASAHADRFDFHELIRQYVDLKAQDNLEEHDRMHARHAGYYAAWLHQQEGQLQGRRQQEVLHGISLDIDNIHSAWNWMVKHRQTSHLQQSLVSLFVFYDIRNWLHQGMAIFEQAITMIRAHEHEITAGQGTPIPTLLGELMVCQGHMCWHLGHTQNSRELLQRSIELLGPDRSRPMLCEAVLYLSLLEHSQGNFPAARRLAEECVALNRTQERRFGVGYALSNLGMVYLTLGEHEAAYDCLEESVEVMRAIEHPRGTAITLTRLGLAAMRLGRSAEARQYLEEGLETTRNLRDRWGVGNALDYLGLLAQQEGDLDRAEALIGESVRIFEEDGDRVQLAFNLADLGYILSERNTPTEARRVFLKALEVTLQSGTLPAGLYALTGIAAVQAGAGADESAYELAAYSSQHPSSSWQTRQRAGELLAQLEKRLAPQTAQAKQAHISGKPFEAVARELLSS